MLRMMSEKVVIEVLSRDTIKPSSPTPHHLRNFELSLIDQLSPLIFVRTILFYAAVDGINADDQVLSNVRHIDRSNLLKRSLSETLTSFYPVAGRLKDNMLIDCNDEGVDYFEARVNGKMSEFMRGRNDEYLLYQQLILESLQNETSNNSLANKEPLLVVQVNMFDCGGTAITVCLSHKIADAFDDNHIHQCLGSQ